VGCSTASHLKQNYPHAKIAILERGMFPSGASSKNAGFACFGSLTELADDLPNIGEDDLVKLVKKRWDGLQKLQSILGKENIDFQQNRGFELIRDKELAVLDQIDYFNNLLRGTFKSVVFNNEPELVKSFGFDKKSVHTIVSNQFEGQIDTGKMISSWWKLCGELGINIYTGVEVKSVEGNGEVIAKGPVQDEVHFKANKLAICTNAFAHKFYPREDINPGRGMVMITQPIDNLPVKGVFHYDEGYFYFRDVGNRLLIGGGRNLDMAVENTDQFGINNKIKEQIQNDVKEMILPDQQVEWDMEWSGIMAFGATKAPIVKMINDDIAMGVRLGGMGVAIGTQVGAEISELLISQY
jgi:glycine/D-amino acid oxidase-like deaminating enzyme